MLENEEITQIQRERLAHIEFKAYFMGKVGRKDLIERFGIKDAAATRDFSKYQEIAPKNLQYDPKNRCYIPSSSFHLAFKYSTSRVLSTIAEGFGDGLKNAQVSDLLVESPTQLNEPRLSTVAVLSRSIVNKNIVRIGYRSLSSGESEREILPFALVDNGIRWHVRAYDRRRGRFSDFVVTRIERPAVVDAGKPLQHELPAKDKQWNTMVKLELIPHPRLEFKETIERDYGMKHGVKKVSVRAALAGYVLRRWNVDCSHNHVLEGDEYHLALKNIEAIDIDVDTMVLAPGYEK